MPLPPRCLPYFVLKICLPSVWCWLLQVIHWVRCFQYLSKSHYKERRYFSVSSWQWPQHPAEYSGGLSPPQKHCFVFNPMINFTVHDNWHLYTALLFWNRQSTWWAVPGLCQSRRLSRVCCWRWQDPAWKESSFEQRWSTALSILVWWACAENQHPSCVGCRVRVEIHPHE